LLAPVADRGGKGGAVATVEARLVDRKGVMCLDSRLPVRFDLAGDPGARLLDNLGTASGSRLVQLANGRARISIARAASQAVVSVSAEGLPAAFVTLPPAPRAA
jgi:beta-galactosidase